MNKSATQYGCSAHYCYINGPQSGMCTNGGCGCLRGLPTGLRLAIERRIIGLEQKIKRLESQAEQQDREYRKHEFCNTIDCPALMHGKCQVEPDGCIRTANEFHHWLSKHGFKIVKAAKEG